jgi:hypothetical protein
LELQDIIYHHLRPWCFHGNWAPKLSHCLTCRKVHYLSQNNEKRLSNLPIFIRFHEEICETTYDLQFGNHFFLMETHAHQICSETLLAWNL